MNGASNWVTSGPGIYTPDIRERAEVAGANDQGGRGAAAPRADASRATTAWSIPEILVVKDDQGRLRIDQADATTYGAYAARQFQATAEADPKYRDGMTKRPSAPSIKLTYVNGNGERVKLGVREIFCRMDGDALVLTHFENAEGEKVKDLPFSPRGTCRTPKDDAIGSMTRLAGLVTSHYPGRD